MSKTFRKGSRVIVKGEFIPGTIQAEGRGFRLVAQDNGVTRYRKVSTLAKIGSDQTIIVSVRGGCVQDVEGLPPGWTYCLNDYDDIEAGEAEGAA